MVVRADGDHVESAGVFGPARLLQQKVLCGGGKAGALARIHAFHGAAPGGMPPVTHLDEYYCIAVEHDQIKLALAALPVLGDQAQALALQVLAGQVFAGLALLPGVAQMPLAGSGCTWPSRYSAQGSWRCTR